MSSKLADWDDDDPSVLPETGSRWDKVVILKHMFTLQELEVSLMFDFPFGSLLNEL
jgi:HIV Tat-specific factor 1